MEGLGQAYKYKEKDLHNKEITGFFASSEDTAPEINEFFFQWNAYRGKNKTRDRGVTMDTPLLKSYGKFINNGMNAIEAKFLPESRYSAKISIEACDDKFVRIFIYENIETLIIESPKITQAVKEIFELVWKGLDGKYEKPTTCT